VFTNFRPVVSKNVFSVVRFRVPAAAATKVSVVWVVAPSNLVAFYHRSGCDCCFQHEGNHWTKSWWLESTQKADVFKCSDGERRWCGYTTEIYTLTNALCLSSPMEGQALLLVVASRSVRFIPCERSGTDVMANTNIRISIGDRLLVVQPVNSRVNWPDRL
jgi:hypothetical protein